MNLEVLDLELEQLDFKDRYGQYQSTRGCSIMGRSQFAGYLAQASKYLEGAEVASLAQLYQEHDSFRHCCDRALQLNGIDPDCLDGNGQLLRALLFDYSDGPGMLVRVNMVKVDGSLDGAAKTEGSAEAMVAASILSATNNLKEALDALDHPDGKMLLSILKARSDAIEEAEAISKGKDPDFENWVKDRQKKQAEQANQASN